MTEPATGTTTGASGCGRHLIVEGDRDRQIAGRGQHAADALRQAEGELAGVWVEVRVSGRGDYQAEMRDLVERLLIEGGYAFDDYSGDAWSLEQFRHGRPTGQTFRATYPFPV